MRCRAGAIKTAADASFYANLIRDFVATYAGSPGVAVDYPPVARVPQPPHGISPQERMEFYQADLARAFGEEFIFSDYQPPSPARRAERGRAKGAKVKGVRAKR
jgi:hypothetical protein